MPVTKRLTIETVNFDDDDEMDEFWDQVTTEGLEKSSGRKRRVDSAGSDG